jgi:hypothetical protein
MLTGPSPDPPESMTVVVCDDAYEFDRYSTGGSQQGGCHDREIGQTILIKRVDGGDGVLYVRSHGWSGVVSNEDVEPLIPGGVSMVCQASESLTLFSEPNDRADTTDLRDQPETVRTLNNRRAHEVWALKVKVVKGYRSGTVGYLRSDDLAACTVSGVQVVMQESD